MMEPKIRFKGFEGEWKTSTIGEIAPLQRGYDLPTNNVISGTIPVVYSNGILRFHNEGKCQAPAIITGRSGTIGKFTYIDHGEYWPHNTSLWVTTFHKNYPRFVYYFFQNVGFEKYATGSGVPTLNRNDIHKHIESIPSNKEEQQAIASYFTTLDSQISASTSRLASLKQMKAASLQAMFPQEGETVPKIRFKGFKGEWKKVKADSIFKTFNEKNRPDLPVLSATQDRGMVTRESIGYNIFHDTSNEATYKHILPGQFVIHLRSFQGGFAHSEIEGIASPAYTIIDFKNKDLYHDYYWRYVFMSKEFIKRLELITYGIRDGRSISYDEFKEMSFLVPSKEEQIKIASYLKNLDRQISLQSQRLEKLKQIKSACLDKMFV
ncbi:MAG: restriction endonuclease subunit S [Prevotella sp.]|nr:restriction endonuclease subunit S [Prevotella sp.]